jgi:hypothetical protein
MDGALEVGAQGCKLIFGANQISTNDGDGATIVFHVVLLV